MDIFFTKLRVSPGGVIPGSVYDDVMVSTVGAVRHANRVADGRCSVGRAVLQKRGAMSAIGQKERCGCWAGSSPASNVWVRASC